MRNFFYISNFTKHFTIVNIIVALISLTIVGLFKLSSLPTLYLEYIGVNLYELHQYILTGFLEFDRTSSPRRLNNGSF